MRFLRFLLFPIAVVAAVSCEKKSDTNKNSHGDSIVLYSLDDYQKVRSGNIKIVDSNAYFWKQEQIASNKPWLDPFVVYSKADLDKIKRGKLVIVDTTCLNATERAEKSIAKNDLTYFEIRGLAPGEVSDGEFEALLKIRNIKFRNVSRSCIRPPEGFRLFCYQETMNAEIAKRFGAKFIDSLRHQADLDFVRTHPDYVFSWTDLEATIRYGDKNGDWEKEHEKLSSAFRNAVFDGKYNPKVRLYFNFVIYRNGTAGDLKIERGTDDTSTSAERATWQRKAAAFISRAKWNPANYRGIAVNSSYFLDN